MGIVVVEKKFQQKEGLQCSQYTGIGQRVVQDRVFYRGKHQSDVRCVGGLRETYEKTSAEDAVT